MRILFLTLVNITDINSRHIYTDLMRKFRNEGHEVYIVSPSERRLKQTAGLSIQNGIKLLKVKTPNIQKTNLIEKGIGTLLYDYLFIHSINKNLGGIHFDLILYSTPPITLTGVIKSIKKKTKAISYLMLKDIFPQNAVDLNMIKRDGLLHKYFRYKEKKLYEISDYIGCMSPANVDYLILNNPKINPSIVEVCPNSIEVINHSIDIQQINEIRDKYTIPKDKTIFIYGGNLGKPQGIDFLLQVLVSNKDNQNAFFIIIGTGTEFNKIKACFDKYNFKNSLLIPGISKNEFDLLVKACDVGMIFLDNRFTIPNYPSRLLTYLENKMPVISATDTNSDIGQISEENGYGLWSLSGDLDKINHNINKLAVNSNLISTMGEAGYAYLLANYNVDQSYKRIILHT